MTSEIIKVPDLGGADEVEVIEVCVSAGDVIAKEDSLVVLESDKASMEVPSPLAGKVLSVLVSEGDNIKEGENLIEIEIVGAASIEKATQEKVTPVVDEQAQKEKPAPAANIATQSSEINVDVPDIGTEEEVEVIEVCVSVGASVSEGDSLIVLESDKASMEVPSPQSGVVKAISVKEGDNVTQGSPILVLVAEGVASEPVEDTSPAPEVQQAPVESKPVASTASTEEEISVPDIGTDEFVEVIEVCIAVGDDVAEGDSLVVLESDKASMEVPSPTSGKVVSISVKEGDSVKNGTPILKLSGTSNAVEEKEVIMPTPAADARQGLTEPKQVSDNYHPVEGISQSRPSGDVYAGPAVRKMAREIGLDLSLVPGSGPKGRIQKADVKAFIKDALANKKTTSVPVATGGAGIPAIPEIDFSQFGDVTIEKMTKMHKVTSANMHRSWLNVPHVTAFDDVDITDLEEFRATLKAEAEKAGVKITPLPFLLKACAAALKANPIVNSSLHADGESIVYKNYVHIGMAVDTPAGLVVPVIRDVDKKSIFELAAETAELAAKAKERKLKPAEMQGGTFTISSLGAMGGTGFTPIVNAPEVAILGVSKLDVKPKWNGEEFIPRKMLPLCLSYDHRAVNGADAGRFMVYLSSVLSDIRRLALQ